MKEIALSSRQSFLQVLLSYKLLLALLVILAIDAVSFGLVIPVLKPLFLDSATSILPLETSLALRQTYLSLTLALFPLAVFIGTPLLGILSDRIGRKKVLFLSLLGSILGFLLAGISVSIQSAALLLASRFLSGLTSASQPIAQATVADISAPKQKALYLGLVACAMTLGMLAGPVMGGLLSDQSLFANNSFATPFYIGAVLALINFIILLLCLQETLPSALIKTVNLRAYFKQSFGLFKKPNALCLIAVFFLLEFAWSLYFQTVPVHLANYNHFSPTQVSLFITFLGLSMCFGLSVIFKVWIKKASLPKIIQICLLSAALALFADIFLGEVFSLLILSAIPLTLAVGMAYTALLTLISNHLPSNAQGWIMSFAMTLLALAWGLTGLLSGFLISQALFMMFAIGLLAIVVAVLLMRKITAE